MYTAGVDAGLREIKIVILKDREIVAKGKEPSGGIGRGETIDKLWIETLGAAGISDKEVSRAVSTGEGKRDVIFAYKAVVEEVAAARAARFVFPAATSVVDTGADQTRVVTLGEGRGILETVRNQKCMAGLGLLLEYMAERLDFTIEEFAALGPAASKGLVVNDGCPVFAELDALEALNRGISREEVAGAVTETVIVRLNSILNEKIPP
jgi:activator of 2-hydroxyglutaryl-CoA dehydratase